MIRQIRSLSTAQPIKRCTPIGGKEIRGALELRLRNTRNPGEELAGARAVAAVRQLYEFLKAPLALVVHFSLAARPLPQEKKSH
jgi:hypothetical protein